MAAPQFILTADTVAALLEDSVDSGDALDASALAGMGFTFVSNVPTGTFVPIDDGVYLVGPVQAQVNSSGVLCRVDPFTGAVGAAGVPLLADDPSLGLEGTLQWQVRPDPVTVLGNAIRPRRWWFDAQSDGTTIGLDELTAVSPVDVQITRGPRGYPGAAIVDTNGNLTAISAAADLDAVRDVIDAVSPSDISEYPAEKYASIQAALDACGAAGGGIVKLPPGPIYVPTGGFHLPSRVTLEGPHVRHANAYQTYVDGSGFYRPGNINTATGLAAFDGAYLVPEAGSTGPMIWAGTYDTGYAVRNLTIFGVDVYGQNISPGSVPSWTNSFAWNETAGTRTSGQPTLSCSVIQAMPTMVNKAITGTGIPAGTTVSSVSVALNQITMSANATSTATGTASFTVAGGMPVPATPISGRQAISFGTGCYNPTNRTRSLLENVYTWGCGSGGPGTTANNRSWSETNATTDSTNAVTLSSVTVSPLMTGAPVTGTGIPVGAVVAAISSTSNRIFLSANATTSATGVSLTIGGSTFTSVLQQVYVGTPGIYVGCQEVIMRGVTCYMGGGDGLVVDGGDGQIDGDNMMGFNNGWGLRTTINGAPVRSVGAIDSFQNGVYGGAGNAYIEGAGHAFNVLHLNTAGKENLKFGRCTTTAIYYLNATDAGLRFSTDSTRYNSVSYAAPAASTSNPIWNTASNTGVTIFGGDVSSKCGFEDHFFAPAESTASFPVVVGMNASGTVWNAGTPDSSVFGWAQSLASNWRFIGGAFPQRLMAAGGTPPFVRGTSSTADGIQVYSFATGTVVSGFGANGALYQPVNTATVSGSVTIDASKGRVHALTLSGNITSMTFSNLKTGQIVTVHLLQDATGSRTATWAAICKFAGGAAPTLSTTAGWADAVTFYYDGTNLRETARSLAIR